MKNLSRYNVVPEVRKIAVVRVNGIGDFIFSLPALEAVRAAYPEAEIVLLARVWHAAFLKERPGPVDRVVVIPSYGGVSEPPGYPEDAAEVEAFFAAMRRERFDIAIQMHGGGRHSNPFTLRLGAHLTIGTKTPDADAPDRWMPYVYFQPEILRHLELVSLIGASPVMLEPCLAVTSRDLDESIGVVPEHGKPLVALHPGAGDPRRRWSPEQSTPGGSNAPFAASIACTTTAAIASPSSTIFQPPRSSPTPLICSVTLNDANVPHHPLPRRLTARDRPAGVLCGRSASVLRPRQARFGLSLCISH